MAGAQDGYRVDITAFPDGADPRALDKRLAATATFTKDAAVAADPLFAHVLARRSLKEPYDTGRAVSDQVLARLQAVVGSGVQAGATNKGDEVAELRRLTHEAMDIEFRTPHAYKESVDLFRIGKAEDEANPDGIDFSGPLFETLAALGQFSREIALDQSSSGFKQGYDSIMKGINSAMGYVWLSTATNTRADQIRAGRDWLRVNLAATGLGVGTQPLSQALQEYSEMKALYERTKTRLAAKGGIVQMFARLGYGPKVPPAPRWRLKTKIM
jgi:hypothetical protein